MRRLVIRPGAIGDTIVSLPALERLCPAEVWAPARNLPLVEHLARARSFSSVQLDLLEIDPPRALVERLRTFDEIVSWYGSARAEFAAALQVVGVPFLPLRALPTEGCGCHAVDFYLKQAGFADAARQGIAPRLPVPRRTAGSAFIAIQPFSGSAKKNWDLAAFQAAGARLSDLTGLRCEWCAGPEEELPGAHRIDALGELAEWLSGAALYLGNDSGVSHLAAACGVPSVAIFKTTDDSVWAPRGPRVVVLKSPDVDQAVQAALGLLHGHLYESLH